MAGKRFTRALTLLELLIVIAIVALLLMMALPILSRGSPAVIAACMSNQKQLALGAIMYAQDSKGSFPNLDDATGNDGPATIACLTNYARNQTNIFMCPAVVQQREANRRFWQPRFVPQLNVSFFKSNGNDYAYYDGISFATNAVPMIADRLAWTNRVPGAGFANHANGRLVVGFTDGHTTSVRANVMIGTSFVPAWSAVQDPFPRL